MCALKHLPRDYGFHNIYMQDGTRRWLSEKSPDYWQRAIALRQALREGALRHWEERHAD